MWSRTYSVTVTNIRSDQVWKIWSDVNNWYQWDADIEWAKLEGPFAKNAILYLKPKQGPQVTIKIKECIPNKSFIDCAKFPLAKMYMSYQIEEKPDGLHLITSVKISGLLGFLWRRLVAEKVAANMPKQTKMLIKMLE